MDQLNNRSIKKWFLIIVLIVVIIVLIISGYYLFKSKIKTGNSAKTNSVSDLWPKSSSIWPMFHGNYNHTGYANIAGPATNKLKWKYLIGATEGNFPNSVAVAHNGVVFVAGANKMTALNADGTLKWVKDYISAQGPGLSVDGATLYFDSGSVIVAVSALDGSPKWEFKAGNNMVFGPTIGPDGTIYQGSWDKNFYAINSDGTLKWKYLTKGTVSYPPSIDQNGNIYLGGGDAHFGPDGNIYAFEPGGKLLWVYDTKTLRVGTPAIGYDGLLYFPASPDLFVLNIKGELVWKKGPEFITPSQDQAVNEVPSGTSDKLSAPCPPPPAPCGNISGGTATQGGGAQGGPSGLKIDAGMEVIAGIITPALTPNNLIYIGNPQGKFMAIDAKTQEIKWSYQTDKNPDPKGIDFGLPSFVITDKGGTSYFGAFDHKFYAIDSNGKLKWSYETGNKITEASPAMGSDGTLYFTSEDGYIYAINSAT